MSQTQRRSGDTSAARGRLAAFTANKALDGKVSVARVMGAVLDTDLKPAERGAAEAIIEDLCADTIEAVRVALARSVASSPHLPKVLAERLANDIEEVSIPMLQLSPVLTDEVLTAVVSAGTPRQVEAAARRIDVSEQVSDAIVDRQHLPAVAMLVGNPTANIAATTWEKAIDRFGSDPGFARSVQARGGLSDAVSAKLVQAAQAHVRAFIVRYLNVPESSLPSLERIDPAAQPTPTPLLPRVVPDAVAASKYAAILKKHGRLEAKLLLKALCSGEIDFLIHALAQINECSFARAQEQLYAAEPGLFADFLDRAGIEGRLIPAFRAVLTEGDRSDLAGYQRMAVARVNQALANGGAAAADRGARADAAGAAPARRPTRTVPVQPDAPGR